MRLLALLLLAACSGPSEKDTWTPSVDDTGETPGIVDEDGDGWLSSEGDCDDNNPDINPDAEESCDGIDNNCNDEIDEGADIEYYLDADGDGFGDPTTAVAACDVEENYVANSDDCDDTDATAYPGAEEICDGVDDDCDYVVDNDPVDPSTWYADADGDGYGDPAVTETSCNPGVGYIGDATDCDDANAAFHPGADEADCADPNDYNCDGSVGYTDADGDGYAACAECDDADAAVNGGASEVCDGVDNDCDGATDEDTAGAGTWYADADGDGYGDDSATTIACDAPVGYVATGGDCDDADATLSPGAVETCDGIDQDCDGAVDDSATDAVTLYPDNDGDAYGDMTAGVTACSHPTSYIPDGTDCDDTRADDHPGADESCDGRDNDCDGTTDEDGLDGSTWYADADADGYGDASSTTEACDAPIGYVASATDCDDTDAAFNPGAAEACDESIDYNCDGSTGYTDADGDGFAACEECDDTRFEVNGDATEICDGIDDDCDGETDEADAADVVTWYGDADGDGYGVAGTTAIACDAPSGYAATDDDCDDTSASVRPDAIEVCDGLDQDCDGTIDESASDAGTWYLDADTDGYGDAATPTTGCSSPAGYVADATDCDDAAPGIFPGATETCDGVDDDCDGAVDIGATDAATWYADTDADGYGAPSVTATSCSSPTGYVADATDCDDADGTSWPGAAETCDGRDNDCDTTVDEDATDASTWYADADSDGYGDLATSIAACDAPAGYLADATDCDDTSADANPGGLEVCDDADDDCDGLVDEDALDAYTWYADDDADGYGALFYTALSCDEPAGFVTDATDCDDAQVTTYPGATETCDEADNDCDGDIDEGATGASTWYADADADGYGDASVTISACDAPTGYVADATDCDDVSGSVNPGAAEVCGNGTDDDCDDTTRCRLEDTATYADADIAFEGTVSADYVGSAVAGDGDFDGDGTDDVVVGAYGYDSGSTGGVGRTYVFSGPVASGLLSGADATFTGSQSNESSGSALAYVPDLDGDGADELLVGSYLYDEGGATDAGRVYLIPGGSSTGSLTSRADTTFKGVTASDRTGYALDSAGDVDGDGQADILIGAYARSSYRGAVGLWYGGSTGGSENFTNADVTFTGSMSSDYVGAAVAGAGDVDGDGLADFLIGAYGEDTGGSGAGAAYLILGAPGSASLSPSSADAVITGTAASDRLGLAVAGLGDTDGDGRDDFAVSADYADAGATDAGAVYVFTTAPAGTVSASTANARLLGVNAYDYAGRTVAGPGDLDDDGYADLVVGATGFDAGSSTGVGAVYFVYGPLTSGSLSAYGYRRGSATSDAFGYAVAAGGDNNADGFADVLIGAIAADPASVYNAGTAWLYYGAGE